uniref:Cytochrome c oxidase assembly protein COX11, mitochondrial n=1 Tax=Phallusia mammillata TaxID=59560 RepID=A0A6F9DAN0_9ASCI|nr:cytochrome c oxidase assembly protein COX11, mitochondrial-like [Phallusia mammillata]
MIVLRYVACAFVQRAVISSQKTKLSSLLSSHISNLGIGKQINTFAKWSTKTSKQFYGCQKYYNSKVLYFGCQTPVFPKLLSWQLQNARSYSQGQKPPPKDNTSTNTVIYIVSVLIFMLGMSYAAVPMYKMFCQATGLGGDPKLGHKMDKVESMEPIRERRLNIYFNADHHAAMQWNFRPSQKVITVVPGETALAFYTAKNPTDEPIVGIATYNVLPTQAGLYFNKIQCFCFEEQWLNPHEEVDMPVFFYIDPDFDDDPSLADVDDVVLSYTFFKAEEGMKLPLPGFMNVKSVQTVNAAPA